MGEQGKEPAEKEVMSGNPAVTGIDDTVSVQIFSDLSDDGRRVVMAQEVIGSDRDDLARDNTIKTRFER